MFELNIVFFLIISIIESQCWVFNNVDFRQLKAKNLDILEDYDSTNEIDVESVPLERLNLIYPGTKWCGAGDIADGYDDLGPARETDICCREHDKCPDVIPAGETKHNLTNDAFYSRHGVPLLGRSHYKSTSEAFRTNGRYIYNIRMEQAPEIEGRRSLACACDEKFRRCLRAVNSKTSTVIGRVYFDTLGTHCFREDYPVTGCKRRGGWLNSKCLEYEYNPSKHCRSKLQ